MAQSFRCKRMDFQGLKADSWFFSVFLTGIIRLCG